MACGCLPCVCAMQNDCSATSPYFDYPGAMRCLMEDAGDVAFVKDSAPVEYASDGTSKQSWSTLAAADMRLLCPSGGCKPINQPGGCTIATVPSRAVMVRAGYADASAVSAAILGVHANAQFSALVFNQASNPRWVSCAWLLIGCTCTCCCCALVCIGVVMLLGGAERRPHTAHHLVCTASCKQHCVCFDSLTTFTV